MMHVQLPDLINGLFELFGGVSIWLNVRRILADKKVRGVSLVATAFFTSWGWWNCYYYPSLGQWLSFVGGVVIVTANSVWIVLAWRYRKS